MKKKTKMMIEVMKSNQLKVGIWSKSSKDDDKQTDGKDEKERERDEQITIQFQIKFSTLKWTGSVKGAKQRSLGQSNCRLRVKRAVSGPASTRD
jgi:hypothetical protein